MRLLVLYSRSRGLFLASAVLVASTLGAWALDNPRVQILLLALGMGVAVASVGLGSPDVALDRTGALPWPLWRGVHLVAATAIVFGLTVAIGVWDAGMVLRDTAGLAGLAGLAAAFLGNHLAWTLPVLWTAVCVVGPGDSEVLMWLRQSPESTGALLTASILGATGLLVYAFRGPKGTS